MVRAIASCDACAEEFDAKATEVAIAKRAATILCGRCTVRNDHETSSRSTDGVPGR
jgi:hypothetical protein